MRAWIVGPAIAVALVLASASSAAAQGTGSVAGTVVDRETRQPLAGAQVSVVGTQARTFATSDGQFLLPGMPAGQVAVRAQLIGYATATQTVTVSPGGVVTTQFELQPQAVALEELVVTGYGRQQRGDVTGAVASISADQFVQSPPRDAASLIAGKIAGLGVNTTSGNPAAGTEITLRGFGTLNASTRPLVIVDGVPGSLETVAPQDIASVDVLKDASAAAIYGSRAANGVILITTKRQESDRPVFRYDAYTSFQTIYKMPDFLTAADYQRLAAEGFTTPAGNTFEDLTYATDWRSEIMRETPISQNHNLSMMGGSPGGTNYLASFTYEYGEGMFQKSNNREVTGRVNIGHSMYDGRLTADLNLVTRWEDRFTGVNWDYMWRQATIRNPTDRIYDDNGDWQVRGTYFYTNPVQMLNTYGGDFESRDLRLHGTVRFQPIDAFTLSVLGGTDRGQSIMGRWRTSDNPDNTGINWARRDADSDESQLLEVTGTYVGAFGGHQFTLLGGYSYLDRVEEGFWADNERFPTDLYGYSSLEAGSGLPQGFADMNSRKESYKTVGFFGRLNWDWNNRFLAMLSLRHEGDSRFGADHQWGVFPGVSVGWRLSEESFVPSFINDLKLRAGYGVTGIAPSDPYQSLITYDYDDTFPVGGQWVQGLVPSQNPNPDLRWEKKAEYNLGLDFSMFDYRMAGSVDLYRRDTKDMLYRYDVPVPPYLYGSILANVGHMRNEGIEASLTYDVVRRANFRWQASANWSTNKNALLSLSDDVYQANECFYPGHTGEPIQTDTHRTCIGDPIGNFYGFESVDISEDGEWIVLDSLGNQVPYTDAVSNDRRVLGNGVPDHYVAFNNSFRLGNFDLSVNMRGAFGHQILNFGRLYYENLNNTQYNMLRSALDPVYGKEVLDYPLVYVSYYVEDGDYWKVDNATLGYTFHAGSLPAFMSSAVQSARIYLAGRNLLTLTGYKGMDPEVSVAGAGLNPGTDHRDQYPTTRVFTFGLNLTF
jgi:TonB-linked SusC/RagA family outer membrane protein